MNVVFQLLEALRKKRQRIKLPRRLEKQILYYTIKLYFASANKIIEIKNIKNRGMGTLL